MTTAIKQGIESLEIVHGLKQLWQADGEEYDAEIADEEELRGAKDWRPNDPATPFLVGPMMNSVWGLKDVGEAWWKATRIYCLRTIKGSQHDNYLLTMGELDQIAQAFAQGFRCSLKLQSERKKS